MFVSLTVPVALSTSTFILLCCTAPAKFGNRVNLHCQHANIFSRAQHHRISKHFVPVPRSHPAIPL